MGNIYLLDCTLRDGGYVNEWRFGEDTIKGFGKKIAMTGIKFYEVGFLKGDSYDPDVAKFPTVESFKNVILPKSPDLVYVGMLDMSAPVALESIPPYDGSSIDMIRVIFKKNKADEAYVYCKKILELGYKLSVNFVGTDSYTDSEFINGILRFNELQPDAMAIVDTFGLIKKKQFLRLVYLADNNMAPGIALCYHGHNNLQQAFGNAESLVELNLKRDVCIDACVFGMGRGAGNLNLELIAEYLNENYDTEYRIEPMLQIMDEYLKEFYTSKFWGYSLPLYLSASCHCHPNYAIYLEEKNSLTVKSFNELLNNIPDSDKASFSKEKAEKYYREYQENYIDDKKTVDSLSEAFGDKDILILAPGKSLNDNKDKIAALAADKVTVAVNFTGGSFAPDFVFSSNMRRFAKMMGKTDAKTIITSNMKEATGDYVVNFSSYSSTKPEIIDNSALMLMKLLMATGVKKVFVAGMDGYSAVNTTDYFDANLDYDFSSEAELRNELISAEIREIGKHMKVEFVTPTNYDI
ncbi:4-hydroxy 2-oxovalerate aldolase [Oscillospiraceae bacterium]|nr:4-hydroxy 2-oxovalerate aldolase [Oscillospiraceae bacterium]